MASLFYVKLLLKHDADYKMWVIKGHLQIAIHQMKWKSLASSVCYTENPLDFNIKYHQLETKMMNYQQKIKLTD